eukprot:gene4963-5769_t
MTIINPPGVLPTFEANQTSVLTIIKEGKFVVPEHSTPIDTYKTIVTTALGFIPKAGAYLSGAADVLFTFFMESESNIASSAFNYRRMCHELIDESITYYDDVSIRASLRGCCESIRDFRAHIANLAAKPTNEALKEAVRCSFMAIENDIDGKFLFECRKQKFLQDELSMFCIFATTHLCLLREVTLHGSTWGFSQSTIDIYTNRFQPRMVEYLAHCRLAYDQGVTMIKAAPNPYTYKTWSATVFSGRADHPYDKIDLEIKSTGFDMYNQDLYSITTYGDGKRILGIQPNFKVKSGTVTVSQQMIGISKANISECQFSNTNYSKAPTFRHDYLPREINFDKTSNAVESIKGQSELQDKPWKGYLYTTDEYNWYNLANPPVDRVATGGQVDKPAFPNHKVHNVFGVTMSQADFIEKQIPAVGGIPTFLYTSAGCVSSIAMAFIPEEVFSQNIVYPDIVNLIDPQKNYHLQAAPNNWEPSFIKDYVNIGKHAIRMPYQSWIHFDLDPHDSTKTRFEVRIKMSSKCASGYVSIVSDGATYPLFALKSAPTNAIIAGETPVIINLNRGVGKNIFKFAHNCVGDNYIFIEDLILIPQ